MIGAQNETISCVGNFNLSLNACETVITPDMVSAGPLDDENFDYAVTLTDEHGHELPNATVGADEKGKEITYTLEIVNPTSTGNSCWGVLIVEDKIAPFIEGCQNTGVMEIAPTSCFSFSNIDFTMSMLATDNCDPNPDIIILDELTTQDFCEGDILKIVERTIKAVDNCGNESPPCRIIIPIQRVELELLEDGIDDVGFIMPKDTIILCDDVNAMDFPDNLDFNGNPNPVTLSGVPLFQVNAGVQFDLLPPDEMIHCKLNVVYADSVLVVTNCFTKIVRHWTILESCIDDPQELTFTQNISIMDLEAPTISNVPNKLNFSTNTGSSEVCAAIEPVPVPTLMDNCQDQDDLTLFVTINGQLPAIEYTGQPLTFPEGQNELVYIGTDGCFNSEFQGVNEVRATVDVWVQDNTPPVCEIDSKAITINNDTGEVLVPASVFDDGSFDDCSKKIKVYANRLDDNCDCAPEDALDRYSDFIYLGRRNGSDYYLSENEVIAPKALNIAVAMGGFVASFENGAERNYVRAQIEDYISTANPPIAELTYFVTNDNQDFPSNLGWNVDQDTEFLMGTTGRRVLQPYDGLTIKKFFVIEVTELCGFSENIRFCCLDVIDGAPVEFRTVDEWGNFNTCDLVVDIQDKVAPIIQCPPAETIFCSDYTEGMDLTVFGDPIIIDACPARITELDPIFDISKCNVGTITRTFEIESGTGIGECMQEIEIIAVPLEDLEEPIDPLDINLPEDGPALGIPNGQLVCFEDLTLLDPFADGFPQEFVPQFIDNRVCSDLGIGFDDDIFEVPGAGPNTCFKVVRRWTIVDACNPEVIDTLYEYDQSIIISNTVPPTVTFTTAPNEICNEFGPNFMCPSEDFTISFTVDDDCTADDDIEVTYFLDLDCDGTFEDIGIPMNNSVSFMDIPIGSHKFIVEAVDACNNVTSATHTFEVINCVAPIAACQSLTMPLHCFPEPPTSPINNNMMLESSAVDCDGDGTVSDDEQELFVYMCSQAEWFAPNPDESYHPCGLPVVYSFSTDTTDVERCFTCADLRCPQEVTIFITDEFGNVDSCVATMTLTDPKGLCPPLQDCIIPPDVLMADLDTICLAGAALPADLSEFGIDAPTIDPTCCNDPDNSITFEDETLADDADGCRVIRRTYTVLTDCGCPMVEEYEQIITVRNDDAPMLSCPPNQTVEADLAFNNNRVCGTRVNLDPATAEDNCQTGLLISNDLVPASGANLGNIRFDVGRTVIMFTATNECGVTDNCRTVVTVTDTTPPVLDCVADNVTVEIQDMSVTLSDQEVIDLVFDTAPIDLCDDPIVPVFDPPMLDCDDIGMPIPVLITVTDNSGNTATCTVNIEVEDGVDAMLACPTGRLTRNIDDPVSCSYTADASLDSGGAGNCINPITYTITGPDDQMTNGAGGSIVGVQLEIGLNTVMYTITNQQGGIVDTCTFEVLVVDNMQPSLICPDDQVLALNGQCRRSVPNYRPQVQRINNCTSNLGPLTQVPAQGTILEGVGTTTITISATASDGTVVTCSFDLTLVDETAPRAICTATANAELDDNCRPRVPELRNAEDACDELIIRNNNGPGPRVYQVPRVGTIWDGVTDVLVIAVDASGNRDTCTVMLTAACPGPDNAPEFQQQIQDISSTSNDECDAMINVPFQIDYCIPANLVVTAAATAGPNIAGVMLTVTNDGVNDITTNFTLAGTVPTGTHTITITAQDLVCDLIVTQEFDVTIVATGGEPATFECKKLVKPIGDDGTVTFLASEIVCVTGGSLCDGTTATLIGSFSNDPTDNSRTFTCADVNPGNAVGTDIQVTMFIFDVVDNGNGLDTVFREPCFVIQTITGELCPFSSSSAFNIAGRIFTEDDRGIENGTIALVGQEETQMSTTEEFGLYAFPSMPIEASYTVMPNKEDRYNNGVSTLDIILIQKHILGIQELNSPYKLIAADVNASGSLTALDLLEMRKVILGIQEGFDGVPSWQMISTEHQFIDPDNPYTDEYPNTYDIASLEKNMYIDFIGIKTGDVNLSADPLNHVSAEPRTSDVDMNFEMLPIVSGSELVYDFSVAQFTDIEGFQFTLSFDESRLIFDGIEGNLLDIDDENIGVKMIDEGIITFSYDKVGGIAVSADDLLFSLRFKHNGNLNADVSINSSVVSAQLYSPEDVYDLGGKVVSSDHDIVLYQNSPNPWSESTEIGFMLPMEMSYELKFYSVSGQLLHTVKRSGDAGLNNVNVYNDDINSNGLIYYELITPNEKTTRRMILLN